MREFNENWVRHTVTCVNTYRKVHHITGLTDTDSGERYTGFITRDEMGVQHDVYRQKIDGKVQRTLWHRGARVGEV